MIGEVSSTDSEFIGKFKKVNGVVPMFVEHPGSGLDYF